MDNEKQRQEFIQDFKSLLNIEKKEESENRDAKAEEILRILNEFGGEVNTKEYGVMIGFKEDALGEAALKIANMTLAKKEPDDVVEKDNEDEIWQGVVDFCGAYMMKDFTIEQDVIQVLKKHYSIKMK